MTGPAMSPLYDELLVLDLDGTLIYATQKPLDDRPADFAGPYHVYKRPHVEEFLLKCLAWFDVGVWTTGSRRYAEWVLDELLPNPDALAFLWTHERCTQKYNCETGEEQEIKRLKKLKRRSFSGCKYPPGRMIVVDDTPSTFRDNYGNAIRVTEYKGEAEDDEMVLLLEFLRRLGGVPDVRPIEKRYWRSEVKAASDGSHEKR